MSDVPSIENSPQWSPLSAKQRRVLGVLMEKSKTTPDAYPMTFSGLTTGCNQKSNRAPITNYSTEQVEQVVNELKTLGAVTLVHGNGRVEKVRHYAYQWLGLSKVEAAIMTELLLRGHQSLGDLRTRASRMEPISDQGELQRMLGELAARNLVVMLTPSGRGQIVSHNLYPEWELEELQKTIAAGGWSGDAEEDEGSASSTSSSSSGTLSRSSAADNELVELRKIVESLAARVEHLERELGLNQATA